MPEYVSQEWKIHAGKDKHNDRRSNWAQLATKMSGLSRNPEVGGDLTALWRANEVRLRKYVSRRVRDRSAVEDIIQDVYVKALQKFYTIDSPESSVGWLFRITVSTVIDYYRRPQISTELPEDLAFPEPHSDEVTELASCVRPMIETLPAKYKEALIMSELDGLVQREVARQSGISLSGAKSRVRRGREQLEQTIRRCCDIKVEKNGIVGYEQRTPAGGSKTLKCCN